MKDSDRNALELAHQNLQSAIEMYEGEVWRSQHPEAGRAVARMQYLRSLLHVAHSTLRA